MSADPGGLVSPYGRTDTWPEPVDLTGYTGPRCVVGGCSNPAAASTLPCKECLIVFGPMLAQTSGPGMTDEQVRERDEATRRAMAEQAATAASVEAHRRRNAELVGDDALGMEKQGQTCWCCEERRTCVRVERFGRIEWQCRACLAADEAEGRS